MAKEIEAKFHLQDEDVETVLDNLQRLNARCKYWREEVNVFYDTPKRKLDKKDQILRIRHERSLITGITATTLTYKGPKSNSQIKTREEHETEVSDGVVENILGAIGFCEHFRFEKVRLSFDVMRHLVEIDELPHLGFFCEIEGENEKTIRELKEMLGCGKHKLITTGYATLLWNDAAKHGRSKKSVAFGLPPRSMSVFTPWMLNGNARSELVNQYATFGEGAMTENA